MNEKGVSSIIVVIAVIFIIGAVCVSSYFLLNGKNPKIANRENSGSSYVIVDTGQTKCYDNTIEISAPQPGQPYYSQDAQYQSNQPRYTLSGDGLTVYDNNTGLVWQRSPGTDGDGSLTKSDKLTWTQAQARPATLNAAHYGGYSDWRLPTIKELYSLIDFRGTGLNPNDNSGLTPFIDTQYFEFAYRHRPSHRPFSFDREATMLAANPGGGISQNSPVVPPAGFEPASMARLA